MTYLNDVTGGTREVRGVSGGHDPRRAVFAAEGASPRVRRTCGARGLTALLLAGGSTARAEVAVGSAAGAGNTSGLVARALPHRSSPPVLRPPGRCGATERAPKSTNLGRSTAKCEVDLPEYRATAGTRDGQTRDATTSHVSDAPRTGGLNSYRAFTLCHVYGGYRTGSTRPRTAQWATASPLASLRYHILWICVTGRHIRVTCLTARRRSGSNRLLRTHAVVHWVSPGPPRGHHRVTKERRCVSAPVVV